MDATHIDTLWNQVRAYAATPEDTAAVERMQAFSAIADTMPDTPVATVEICTINSNAPVDRAAAIVEEAAYRGLYAAEVADATDAPADVTPAPRHSLFDMIKHALRIKVSFA